MFSKIMNNLSKLWSACGFEDTELVNYAERLLFTDTRKGLSILAFVTLAILLSSSILFYLLHYEWIYSQTFLLLGLLCLHVMIASRYIQEIRALNFLGLTLVVIIGTAFVLLAQYAGKFNPVLLANVVLLFMVIPLVPWALRESLTAVGLIYLIFSVSTIMVIARQVSVRKHDIATRFELENAHRALQALSYKDPLTGAYNRRFLSDEFVRIRANYRARQQTLHFALIDLDDFKRLNDTEGHEAGDKTLQTLSETVLALLEPGDYLFRLGGDEFALIFQAADADAWLAQLDGHCVQRALAVRYSTGLARLKPDQDAALADLYNLADGRLYGAKRRRKADRVPTESPPVSGAVARVF